MQCPRCSGSDVGHIRFAFVESGLHFQYCRRCEHRWWEGSSRSMQLGDVLKAATALARTA